MNCKNYEINVAKKLPFCNEKSILPKFCHFLKFFAKHLPQIKQTFAIFSVKHLATLSSAVALIHHQCTIYSRSSRVTNTAKWAEIRRCWSLMTLQIPKGVQNVDTVIYTCSFSFFNNYMRVVYETRRKEAPRSSKTFVIWDVMCESYEIREACFSISFYKNYFPKTYLYKTPFVLMWMPFLHPRK